MSILPFLLFSAFLFALGFALLLFKKHLIFMLMGLELMLVAGNINLVVFSNQDPEPQGSLMALFVLAIGVCEMALALAIVIQWYRHFKEEALDEGQPLS